MNSVVVIVGSGASAVHAAWPLVKAGYRVLMVDGGRRDDHYRDLIPAQDFESIRRSDVDQHRYFLGDKLEGIPFGNIRVGAQLTPPRQHLTKELPAELPLQSPEFNALHSLALGGFASGWGASVPPFTDADMEHWPVSRADLQPHYDAVARRVGICGIADDDLHAYLGPSPALLPPAKMDSNARALLRDYRYRAATFRSKGLFVGQPRLAMTTRKFRGRGPASYGDMDFWSDSDRAVYRPVYTLEELQKHSNFEYLPGWMVTDFREVDGDGIQVTAKGLVEGRGTQHIRCDRLVLAAGVFGTTRIVLKSLSAENQRVPLISNPYTYFPAFLWSRLGQSTNARRHSLTQLLMIFDPHRRPGHSIVAQVYSYRSLLTFKLLKESPFPMRESLALFRWLLPYFVIVGVHHEDHPTDDKYIRLHAGENAPLEVQYKLSISERRRQTKIENELMMQFYRLGSYPLERIDPGPGSSIHYAGTLPMTNEARPLTTQVDGRLRGTNGVFIADGSTFPNLPAKGLTYTLMANADRVGSLLATTLH